MDPELRKCVWMWAGLLTYRLCDRDYRCAGCPVEALFHPQSTERGPVGTRAVGSEAISPPGAWDRFIDSQHLWLRVLPGSRVQVGLDPIAARLLSSATSVRLPAAGGRLYKGDTVAEFELGGEQIRFASPVTGSVMRVHRMSPWRLRRLPRYPYTRGWLFVAAAPRLDRQLEGIPFGWSAGTGLAREWSSLEQECLGAAAAASVGAPMLPDGGEVDLACLAQAMGPRYGGLVRRWIGEHRVHAGRPQSRATRRGRVNRGGTAVPPEGR